MIKKLGFIGAAAVGVAAVGLLGACGSSSGATHTSTSARPATAHSHSAAPSTSASLLGPETQHVTISSTSAHYDPGLTVNGTKGPADYAVNMTWTNNSDTMVTDAAVIGEYDAAGHLVLKTTQYGALLQPRYTWHDNGTLLDAPRTDSVRSFKVLSVTVHGRKWIAKTPGGTK